MASPIQLQASYANDHLFATPNFDDMRDSGPGDSDFSYFDNLNTGGADAYLLDGGDYSGGIDFTAKDRPAADGLVDPFLTGTSAFGAGFDFGSNDNMFVSRELTPPPSAVEERGAPLWPSKGALAAGSRGADPPSPHSEFAQRHGQITPPMSSKSPESEDASERSASASSARRGRKASEKSKKAALAAVADPAPAPAATSPAKAAKPPRKARKTKPAEAEEDQSEEARAKRARFLERNRQAAFTCRQRKKQWAKDLESRHRDLERDNQNLKLVLVSLKDEFHYLRQQVVSHSTCECAGAREYIQRSSRALANGEAAASTDSATSGAAASADGSPRLEEALRASLAHFDADPEARHKRKGSDTLQRAPEGTELDGMTL